MVGHVRRDWCTSGKQCNLGVPDTGEQVLEPLGVQQESRKQETVPVLGVRKQDDSSKVSRKFFLHNVDYVCRFSSLYIRPFQV